MLWSVAQGVALPFWGTALGAACVFFLRGALGRPLQRALTGFAAGVMTAASVWSLLLPAMERSSAMGRWAFVPAISGFWAGVLFLLALDHIIPHLHRFSSRSEGMSSHLSDNSMLILAVVLHNIPEGMAVGAAYAGVLAGGVPASGALVLALGIAIQNFPEGAIVSMPLCAAGAKKASAFRIGVLSGAVEPAGAALVLLAARALVPVLPWCLSFAAGAMIFVVVEELIPEMSGGTHPDLGAILFAAGFTAMMALDVALS